MAQTEPIVRRRGVTYAVSNTGPLISAFQSDSFPLLTRIFAAIHVPMACAAELEVHGWEKARAASPQLAVLRLTWQEERRAEAFARQVAQCPEANDSMEVNHRRCTPPLGEAQAMVLALRPEYRDDVLLLDELAARAVAKEIGLRISGFPGVLLLAAQVGLISAEELRERLEACRQKGTHYGIAFIQVYAMARQGRRAP